MSFNNGLIFVIDDMQPCRNAYVLKSEVAIHSSVDCLSHILYIRRDVSMEIIYVAYACSVQVYANVVNVIADVYNI